MTIREEFLARLESDAAFRGKFVGITNEQQLVQIAAANGYDLMAGSSSELMSDEELDNVAGGGAIGDFFRKVVKVVAKGIDKVLTVVGKPIVRVMTPLITETVGAMAKLNKEQKEQAKKILDDVTK